MSHEKKRTTPDLSLTSPTHQEAIAKGNEHFSSWQYNVMDHLKSKSVEEIRQYLKDTALPYAICVENIIGDFNLGTVARNANAFNAKEFFYVGIKKVDRRSMLGVQNYTDIQWLATVDDLIKLKDKYVFIGIDNNVRSVPLSTYTFVPNTLFIFGEEGVGLTPIIQAMCKDIVYIEQQGSVRSLNVGTASGIIMHQFVQQFNRGLNV
jgi:tRNA G18 (ribose-2'-O)-methylase SpoU